MLQYFWKASVQVVLLVLALSFFGLPALKRYQDKKIVVITSVDGQGGLPAPAVTICPSNPTTSDGFPEKGANFSSEDPRVGEVCIGMEGKDIALCVESKGYPLSPAVSYTRVGGSILAGADELSKVWSADFTHTQTGMCFTLNRTSNFSQVPSLENALIVGFNQNTSYSVFLHDPTLFLISYNPLMPIIHFVIEKPELTGRYVVISQHHKLDLPSKPCNTFPSYSLTACVKTALFQDVGCRLSWDNGTQPAWPLCNTLDQFRGTQQFRETSKIMFTHLTD